MRNNLNISIFGLGYVGLPLAIKLSNYFNVLGFDNNKQRIKELKSFLDKNNEVSSKQLKKSKLQYSTNIKDLKNSNIFILKSLVILWENLLERCTNFILIKALKITITINKKDTIK